MRSMLETNGFRYFVIISCLVLLLVIAVLLAYSCKTDISIDSTFDTILGATVGLLAAAAAFVSAAIAKDAANRAHQVEYRQLIRDVVLTLNSVVAETIQFDGLANELKIRYRRFATFYLTFRGSITHRFPIFRGSN